jgi:preprotein translocase subunit SecE
MFFKSLNTTLIVLTFIVILLALYQGMDDLKQQRSDSLANL